VNTPFYLRRWFKVGAGMILIGLFCYLLALHQTKKYEAIYPDLAKDANDLLLENLARTDTPETVQLTDEEKDTRLHITHLHGIYKTYFGVGWVFMVLGVLFIAISFKEPQVPRMEDLDDEPGNDSKSPH
jgi:hypothetical protein